MGEPFLIIVSFQCVFGQTQDITVKYVSKYWFFGGSLGGPGGPNNSTI